MGRGARTLAAAKIPSPPSGGTTVSDFFNGDGGFLIVSEPNGPGPGDNLNVLFVVPPDALPAEVDEVLITMDVSGTTLSQLVMAFQPAGLVFDPWAHINLSVGRDLIDLPLTDLVAWHIYDDGTAEQVPFSIVDNNPYHIQIFIKVPGFSRYGMGGGT